MISANVPNWYIKNETCFNEMKNLKNLKKDCVVEESSLARVLKRGKFCVESINFLVVVLLRSLQRARIILRSASRRISAVAADARSLQRARILRSASRRISAVTATAAARYAEGVIFREAPNHVFPAMTLRMRFQRRIVRLWRWRRGTLIASVFGAISHKRFIRPARNRGRRRGRTISKEGRSYASCVDFMGKQYQVSFR